MYAYAFDISVEPELVECEARVLPAPRLKYNDSGLESICQPKFGQWNMYNKRILVGATVDAWACINFSELGVDIVQNFCNELVVKCNSIGMVFNKTPVISIHSQNPEQIENSLRQLHSQSIEILLKKQNQKHKQLQLLIVILPDLEGSYGRIKTICETELGLVTQCCKKTHLSSMPIKNPYKQNLALKINVKVAGRNTALQDTNRIPPMFAAPSIIFGADVTHPSPGKNSSSISAVVASMDWPHHTKYRALVSAQPSGQEIIKDLYNISTDPQSGQLVQGGMIRELILAFSGQTNQKLPQRIIFYRDGVGECQLQDVFLIEIAAIRKACASIEKDYRPRITFIVVHKRHHTRLFPAREHDQGRNVAAGTVVDKDICHPIDFDFYLCSHTSTKGTSRPAHYLVLLDENEFTPNQLQGFTNDLCYTYARCTRSVSLVPPTYYAHLAAFRARYYLEVTRQRDPAASTLPAIKEQVKNVMFFC